MNRHPKPSVLFTLLLTSTFLIAATFVCFYRLGQKNLEAYDEAWYGSIARNLVEEARPFHLTFNQTEFIDHPPFGFWLMAIFQYIFGSTSFGVRTLSAVSGVIAVAVVIKIGNRFLHKPTGYAVAIMLLSSLWFVYRARSGNLDIPFVCLYLVSIYLWKAKHFYRASLTTGLLIMTKTLVGLSIIPVVLLVLWESRRQLSRNLLTKTILVLLMVTAPWYVIKIVTIDGFLFHHFLEIGLRSGSNQLSSVVQLQQFFLYLRSGIGVWFKPAILGTLLASGWWMTTLLRKKQNGLELLLNSETWLWVWLACVSLPFMFSSQAEVWHLIPIYPPLFLIATNALFKTINLIASTLQSRFKKIKQLKKIKTLMTTTTLILIGAIGLHQENQIMQIMIDQTNTITQEVIISEAAGKLNRPIVLKSWFLPTASFYSQQLIIPIDTAPAAKDILMAKATDSIPESYIISTNERDLVEKANLKIVSETQDYILATDI